MRLNVPYYTLNSSLYGKSGNIHIFAEKYGGEILSPLFGIRQMGKSLLKYMFFQFISYQLHSKWNLGWGLYSIIVCIIMFHIAVETPYIYWVMVLLRERDWHQVSGNLEWFFPSMIQNFHSVSFSLQSCCKVIYAMSWTRSPILSVFIGRIHTISIWTLSKWSFNAIWSSSFILWTFWILV